MLGIDMIKYIITDLNQAWYQITLAIRICVIRQHNRLTQAIEINGKMKVNNWRKKPALNPVADKGKSYIDCKP